MFVLTKPILFSDFANALANPIAYQSQVEKHTQQLAALEDDFDVDVCNYRFSRSCNIISRHRYVLCDPIMRYYVILQEVEEAEVEKEQEEQKAEVPALSRERNSSIMSKRSAVETPNLSRVGSTTAARQLAKQESTQSGASQGSGTSAGW